MKKIVAVLLLVVIFGGFAGVDNASATLDEMPPVMKRFNMPIDNINLLK